jgi:catechol 2,3-dioxygenase-like lactoylglutathione lyase family enzyme
MGQYDHFAFQVGDMDLAIRFYVEKLGFSLSFRSTNAEVGEELAFLALGDLRLELLRDLNRPGYEKPELKPPYCPHLAIRTDDMVATVAQLRDRGVPILHGPTEIPGEETWLYLADPDNNVVEYIQWYRPA